MVNGKLVTLNTEIQNGDTVEIKKSKNARGPSLDWLNPSLGYLGTASAARKCATGSGGKSEPPVSNEGAT